MNPKRMALLKQMWQADQTDPFPLYGMAQEHLSGNELSEALKCYAELRERFPHYLPTYYQYGLLLGQTGQTDAAIEVLNEGLSLAQASQDRKTANEIAELIDDLE